MTPPNEVGKSNLDKRNSASFNYFAEWFDILKAVSSERRFSERRADTPLRQRQTNYEGGTTMGEMMSGMGGLTWLPGLLIIVVLVLGAAALTKYLFSGKR